MKRIFKYRFFRNILVMLATLFAFSIEGFGNDGSIISADGTFLLGWNGYNFTATATTKKNSVTMNFTGVNYNVDCNISIADVSTKSIISPLNFNVENLTNTCTTNENVYIPVFNTVEYGYLNPAPVIKITLTSNCSITITYLDGVIYVCNGSDPCILAGPDISDFTVETTTGTYCDDNKPVLSLSGLTVSDAETGYPTYQWKKDGVDISGATSATYTATSAGVYTCTVFGNASTSSTSTNSVTISAPSGSPSISVNKSSISFTNIIGETATTGTVTASLENVCSGSILSTITGTNADKFSVLESGGVYTVTFNETATVGNYSANLVLSSSGATSKTITLSGSVPACTEEEISTFDFTDGTMPSGITNYGTEANWNGYKICATSCQTNGSDDFGDCISGNVLQFVKENPTNNISLFTLNLPTTDVYRISFICGNNGPNWNAGQYTLSVGGNSVGVLSRNQCSTFNTVVSGVSTVAFTAISNRGDYMNIYFDDIVITKLCPAEVSLSLTSGMPCAGTALFSAAVSGGSSPYTYKWYINGTLQSGETSSTFSPTTHLAPNAVVKVTVTDDEGIEVFDTYTVDFGVDSISSPNAICTGGTLTAPSTTVTGVATSTGWQISDTENGSYSNFDITGTLSPRSSYNGKYIRYYAANSDGTCYTNGVAVTVNDKPSISAISDFSVCKGSVPTFPVPTITTNGEDVTTQSWTIKNSDIYTDYSNTGVNTNSVFRLSATNACGTGYSNDVTVSVNTPTISISSVAVSNGYYGYSSVVATPSVATSCADETTITYTLTDASGYFSIDPTGKVTVSNSAATGSYSMRITASVVGTDGSTYTDTEDITVQITVERAVAITCPATTSYTIYTVEPLEDIDYYITSANFDASDDDISLSLSGTAASYFSLSSSTIEKNKISQKVTVSPSQTFYEAGQTGAGSYNLILTATSEGKTSTCEINITTEVLNEYLFTTNIASSTLCRNATAPEFTVTDVLTPYGISNITYQWYKNGSAISGATSSSYTPTTNDAAGDYVYKCIVGYSGQGSNKTTAEGTITIKGPSDFTITPSSLSTCAVSSIDFTANVAANYTVYNAANTSTGTSSASTAITSTYAQPAGTLEVYTIVSNLDGCQTSAKSSIYVYSVDTVWITKETNFETTSVCSSDLPIELSVEADDCNNDLTYQWYKNGSAISGATTDSYDVTETGKYYCIIKSNDNASTQKKSSEANINVVVSATAAYTSVIPDEIYCSQKIIADIAITASDNSDVTANYHNFYWTKDNNIMKLGNNTQYTYTFDCATEGGKTVKLGMYVTDPNTGCVISVEKNVIVKSIGSTFYYCGETGDNSDLTDLNNWCTVENAAVATCVHPENFTTDGCKYIVNKDDVVLKSDQTWNVGGTGTRIVVSDGYFNQNFSTVSVNGSAFTKGYGFAEGLYAEFFAIMGGESHPADTACLSDVANTDYRAYAKVLRIEGTLNTGDGTAVDVDNGGSLTIATDKGNFVLGDLATDELGYGLYESNSNTYYNSTINPGSSVTYTGAGASKIQSGEYSQMYIETTSAEDVVFPEEGKVEIIAALVVGDDVDNNKINTNESTVLYKGSVNQYIAAIPYYILDLETASFKILAGDIDVEESLYLGTSSTLQALSYDININGDGTTAFVAKGNFDAGTSTVNYNSANETTVAALDYYNLNLGSGDRTFSTEATIGIAGEMTVSDNVSYTVYGSTIEFNGTDTQTIPPFSFYNLVLNNSAMDQASGAIDNSYYTSMSGDVSVLNRLSLLEGVLSVNGKTLEILSDKASAVSQGYYVSDDSVAFVVGNITRNIPDNLTGSDKTTEYVFPVGDINGYKPLTLSQITSGSSSTVTVGLGYTGITGTYSDPTIDINEDNYWVVTGNNYTSGSVGVYTSDGLGDYNSVAYGETVSSVFENLYGSVSNNYILSSNVAEEGIYTLAKRNKSDHKYYYDCTNGGNITDLTSWWTVQYGSGANPTSFSEADAEWIINCSVTLDETLYIDGANSQLTINEPAGSAFTVSGELLCSQVYIKQGTLEVDADAEMTILHSFTLADVTKTPGVDITNRTTIVNDGTMNIYNSTMVLTDSYVTNNGIMNMYNVDLSLSSNHNQSVSEFAAHENESWWKTLQHTKFINNGFVNMTNGSLDVTSDRVHLRNADGAQWVIDNTGTAASKHVTFDGCEFSHDGYGVGFVDFQCGSSFIVKNSDVKMLYKGNGYSADIGGEIVIEDGNLFVARSDNASGGTFVIEQTCGTMYLKDTDGSGDGLLELKGVGGGYEFNVEGTLYAMGIVESGGNGASFNIKDGGTVFVGDIGAILPQYSWKFTINVETGGTLYYCGNRTGEADNVGYNAGTLYYADSYYENNSNPESEKDFSSTGVVSPMWADAEACMASYNEGVNNAGILLPIELTMLYAVSNGSTVEIHWQTASETNNNYFTLLRSFDGVNFEEIAIIWANGTTTDVSNYVSYDEVENIGIVYYKLRQTDYNGNSTETKVISVQTCRDNAAFLFKGNEIIVSFEKPAESHYIIITSITGKIIYSKTFRNEYEAKISVPQTKGVYIISVIGKNRITSERFVR